MSEAYEREPIIFAYIRWHYSKGLRELFGITGNFLWFIANFFSFKILLLTIFVPWKRLGKSYGQGFDLEAWASTFVVNFMMRVIGFLTKIVILIIGSASYIFVLFISFLAIILWVLMPAVLLGSAVLSATFFAI